MSLLKFRENATPEIVELLKSVSLGTNGAIYQHLDTAQRVLEIDNPLHITIERRTTPLINCTICQRGQQNYIRYFAAKLSIQGNGMSTSTRKSGLENQIIEFFHEEIKQGKCFYAYIDPANIKSLAMAERFGLNKTSTIITQTFSRINPKKESRIRVVKENLPIDNTLPFYFHYKTPNTTTYRIMEKGEIIAEATIKRINWRIERLPGNLGGVLTKIIPAIPGVNRIIRPKRHTFIVPEKVYIKDDSPEILQSFLSGVLFEENLNLMIWWIDEQHSTYLKTKNQVNWGPLHRLTGSTEVNLMTLGNSSENKSPYSVNGFDFV